MPTKPIIGQDPTVSEPGVSIDIPNEDTQDKDFNLEDLGVGTYQGKPFLQSSQGSIDGQPVGIKRKYHDKTVTEFATGDNIDLLRKEFNSEWKRKGLTANAEFTDFSYAISNNNIDSNVFQFVSRDFRIPIEVIVEPISFENDDNTLFRRKEKVFIKIKKSDFNDAVGSVVGNKTFFDWFGDKLDFETLFRDNVFEMSLPMNKKQTANFNFTMKTMTADFVGNYNYEIPNYEEQIANVKEQLIQNIYALFSAIQYGETSLNPNLQGYIDHATLNGEVDVILQGLLHKNSDFDFRDAAYSLYLEAWARAIKKLKATPSGIETLNQIADKFKHMIFPLSEKEIFNAFNDLIELFPMYVEMEMSTDEQSPFSSALEETKLSLAMMTFILADKLGANLPKTTFVEVQETTFDIDGDQSDAAAYVSRQSLTEFERPAWDVLNWFKFFKLLNNPAIVLEQLEEDLAFLGDGELEFKVAMSPENDLYRKLLIAILDSRLRSLVKNTYRSFRQILAGVKSVSETVLYRIDKYSVLNEVPNELLQSFWIPNTGDQDVVKFFDTQVKYNTQYIYKVVCYQMVYGTSYRYSAVLASNDGLYETDTHYIYQMTVDTVPNVRLWEVPYYNLGSEEEVSKKLYITKVIDDPPIFPDVELIPFIGIKNKILLNFRANNGEYELEPRFINTSEIAILQEIAQSQFKKLTYNSDKGRFLDSKNNPQTITFESDDLAKSFEVYRSDMAPKDYTDFSQTLHRVVESPFTTFIDDIEPNRVYWYVFRTIDSHGHFSNPTDVYEVKMVDNSGIIYPEINVKSIEEYQKENDQKSQSRVLQKYLQIKPSILQRMFSQEDYPESIQSAADLNKPVLGLQEESVFDNGKKFKIRITSKQTGRKIDINLTFTHIHENDLKDKKAGIK